MRIEYSKSYAIDDDTDRMPLLAVTLSMGDHSVDVIGLVDSGSMVSVIPYSVGLALGAVWDNRRVTMTLAGAFGGLPAIPLAIVTRIGDLSPVNLVFLWSNRDNIRVIFGEYNFFQEFDVHF